MIRERSTFDMAGDGKMKRSFEVTESIFEPNELHVEVALNQPFYESSRANPSERHCLVVSETASGEMIRVTLEYLEKYFHRVPRTPQEEMRQALAGTSLRGQAAQLLRAVVRSGWVPENGTDIDCDRVRAILLPAWENGTLNLRPEGPVGPQGKRGPIGHRGPQGVRSPEFISSQKSTTNTATESK